MNHVPLASSDVDMVIGIVVFVFWVIAAIAGKLKNAMAPKPPRAPGAPAEPTPLQRLQQQIADQIRQMNEGQAVRLPPPLPPERRQPQRKQQRRRPQPVAAPPPPARVIEQPPPVVTTAVKRVAPTVQAPTIRRWLTPATLRQQFIVTELFQPPLSMREEQR